MSKKIKKQDSVKMDLASLFGDIEEDIILEEEGGESTIENSRNGENKASIIEELSERFPKKAQARPKSGRQRGRPKKIASGSHETLFFDFNTKDFEKFMYAKRLWSSFDNNNIENAQFLREMVQTYKILGQYARRCNEVLPSSIPEDLTPYEVLQLLIYSHNKTNNKTNENRSKKFYSEFIKPLLF